MFWIQDMREEGVVKYQKVLGTENPADLMTKNVDTKLLGEHCTTLKVEGIEGRAEKSSKVSKGVDAQVEATDDKKTDAPATNR